MTKAKRGGSDPRSALKSGIPGLLGATAAFRSAQNMGQTTLSLLGKTMDLGGGAIGAISAGSNLVAALTMLLVTARIQADGARRAVVAGSLLLASSLALFLIPSPLSLLGGAFLLGTAGGLTLPSVATVIGHRAITRSQSNSAGDGGPSRFTPARALATLGLVLSLSLVVGPLLESAVLSVSAQNLRMAYLAFLPIALLGALLAAGGRARSGSERTERPSVQQSFKGLRALFSNRRWSFALCAQAIYAVPFSVVVVFGGLLGKSLYHVSASSIEAAIAVFFTLSLLSRAVLTWHPATSQRTRLFGACVALTLTGLALLAIGSGPITFFGALAILGVPHGLTFPLALGLVAESVPTEELGQANASFTAVSSTINVVAPIALGLAIDHLGSRAMLGCAMVPVVLLSVTLARLREPKAPLAEPSASPSPLSEAR